MPLERDSRLGKFLIRQRIGAGGMGEVYRAVDTVLGRTVAIKTLHADKASDRQALARFKREALAISAINHDNIVKVIDFIEGDVPYLVMEYLDGENLDTRIRRTGPLEFQSAVDIMLEVCDAVSKCHRQGYVHRDLKPTNIFLANYDGVEVTKVLDFGVAKVWGDSATPGGELSHAELTHQGVVVGTPRYLAPEILGGQPATPKSDQYSLGIVLYYALTARQAFVSQRRDEFRDYDLFQTIIKGDHLPVYVHRADLPEGLGQVVETAINRDPQLRFGSVHMMGGALTSWASQRGRDRWSDHFSKAPRPVVSPQLSAPIPAGDGGPPPNTSAPNTARDSQFGTVRAHVYTATDREIVPAQAAEPASRHQLSPKASATSLTVVDSMPIGMLANAPVTADPDNSSPLSRSKEGSSDSVDVSFSSASLMAAPARRSHGRLIVAIGAAAIAMLAVICALVLRATKAPADSVPDIASTNPVVALPAVANPSPPPAEPTSLSVAESPRSPPVVARKGRALFQQAVPADRPKRRQRHRVLKVPVDENGVPIPSAD